MNILFLSACSSLSLSVGHYSRNGWILHTLACLFFVSSVLVYYVCLFYCAPVERKKKCLNIICIFSLLSSFSIVCHVCRLLIVYLFFWSTSFLIFLYIRDLSLFSFPFYHETDGRQMEKRSKTNKNLDCLSIYTYKKKKGDWAKTGTSVCCTYLSCQQFCWSANDMILYIIMHKLVCMLLNMFRTPIERVIH